MLIPVFQKPRRQARFGKPKNATPAPPAALTLVSASYDHVGLTLTMAFDRAIDISNYNGGDVEVDDGTYHSRSYFAAGAVTLVDAVTVRVGLVGVFGDGNPGVFLTAANDTNIVAVDDGGTWAGCTEVELPFG